MAWHKVALVDISFGFMLCNFGKPEVGDTILVCAEKVRSLATFMYCEVVEQDCGDDGQSLAVVPCMPLEFGLSTDLILPCYDTVHQQGVIVPVQKLPLTRYLRKSEDGQCPFYAVFGQRIVNSQHQSLFESSSKREVAISAGVSRGVSHQVNICLFYLPMPPCLII